MSDIDIDEAVRLARDTLLFAADFRERQPFAQDVADRLDTNKTAQLARAVLALHERCEKLTAVYEAAVAYAAPGFGDPWLAARALLRSVDAARRAGTEDK